MLTSPGLDEGDSERAGDSQSSPDQALPGARSPRDPAPAGCGGMGPTRWDQDTGPVFAAVPVQPYCPRCAGALERPGWMRRPTFGVVEVRCGNAERGCPTTVWARFWVTQGPPALLRWVITWAVAVAFWALLWVVLFW